MTLKEFIANLNEVIKKNPKAENYLVVYAVDDEGNSFSPVHLTPSIGIYSNGDMLEATKQTANSICIN